MSLWGDLTLEFKIVAIINLLILGISLWLVGLRSGLLQGGELILAGVQAITAVLLVYLYKQQKDVLALDFEPDIRVSNFGPTYDWKYPLQLELSNVGKGTASELSLRLEPSTIDETEYRFEPTPVSMSRVQSDLDEEWYEGAGDYLAPDDQELFRSSPPRINYYGSDGGSGGWFNFGTSGKDLQENGIYFLRLRFYIDYSDSRDESYSTKFYDRVVPIVRKAGIDFSLRHSMPYELYNRLSNSEKHDINDTIITQEDVGKDVVSIGGKVLGEVESVEKGVAFVECPDGIQRVVRSAEMNHTQGEVQIDATTQREKF